MTTMVEKIAKAIAKAAVEQNPMLQYFDDNGVGYFDDYDNKNYDCIAIARSAIEAMMEPTDAMYGAANDAFVPPADASACWRSMIQAALKEGKE